MERPRSVRCPDEFAGLFLAAERVVESYFEQMVSDPEQGALRVGDERYVLLRASSLSVEFFALVEELFGAGKEEEAGDFARNLLFDLAHSLGKTDALSFHEKMGLEDPVAKLSAGPVHFAYTGWSLVDIEGSSQPSPDEDFLLLYDHPTSFEADAWISSGRRSRFPVCIMNAGYSSGWCEESFGVPLVASELLCRGAGDEHCRFVMAPPARIEEHIAAVARGGSVAVPGRVHRVPDFFARKRLEDELRRSRDEMEERVVERTRELEEANRALQDQLLWRERAERRLLQSRKLQALGGLAGGIAHDFNNILTTIIGFSRLAFDALPADHPAHGHVAEVAKAAERASGLTRQLLVFSRQEASEEEVVGILPRVEAMHSMLARLIGEHIDFQLQLEAPGAHVRIDPSRLEQLVMNLVLNARDAMPEGGQLLVRVGREELGAEPAEELAVAPGPAVVLSVEDDGVGMDEEQLEHIFEPFFTTKDVGEGTGLGLATVYAIATRAGGAVDVKSEPGQGSCFRVYFPEAPARPARAAPASGATATPLPRPRRVVLVEDEDPVRRLLEASLADAGWEVRSFADGLSPQSDPADSSRWADVLLTDVILPGLSGPRLAQWMCGRNPGLRVLFMSGYTGEELGQHGVDTEGQDFVQKPFDLPELLDKLARLAEAGDEQAGA